MYLNYNHITRISDGAFLESAKMTYLTLANNKLKEIRKGFYRMFSMYSMDLSDNRVRTFVHAVVARRREKRTHAAHAHGAHVWYA